MSTPTSPHIHLVDDELLLDTLRGAVRTHVKSRQRHQADRESRERFALLSEREREVLALIVGGLTNKEIGRALGLSPRTVETHRANLFAKLGAESLAQVIRRYADLAEGAALFYGGPGVGARMGNAAADSYSGCSGRFPAAPRPTELA
jgi:DNA-binding CsgD family transcriptional regulator